MTEKNFMLESYKRRAKGVHSLVKGIKRSLISMLPPSPRKTNATLSLYICPKGQDSDIENVPNLEIELYCPFSSKAQWRFGSI